MGIESDQLVFDYLSRVGDLAHGTAMTAAERARLVTALRGEIDRLRAAEGGAHTAPAVRKILGRLGKPEELVAAAAGGAELPGPRTEPGGGVGGGLGGDTGERPRARVPRLPQMRKPEPPPPPSTGASPPHLAGMDELGPEESDPDWWRLDPSPYGSGGRADRPGGNIVPGFVGGIELPEVMKPPPKEGESRAGRPTGPGVDKAAAPAPGTPAAPEAPASEAAPAGAGNSGGGGSRGALLGFLLARRKGGPGGPTVGGVVELAAAALLVAGAVMGSLIPLGVGWLAAWWSPKLSRTEAKGAVLAVPGLVAGAGAVWLWGRSEGRWGERIPEGGDAMQQALEDTWPVVLRAAAVASALFLVWRARRRRG